MRQEVEVRKAYDAVAETYADNRFGHELDAKAADRALLRELAAHAEGA